eukprot:scaffold2033_cov367-Prasinococcus_capsulatus_cf.AAC.1
MQLASIESNLMSNLVTHTEHVDRMRSSVSSFVDEKEKEVADLKSQLEQLSSGVVASLGTLSSSLKENMAAMAGSVHEINIDQEKASMHIAGALESMTESVQSEAEKLVALVEKQREDLHAFAEAEKANAEKSLTCVRCHTDNLLSFTSDAKALAEKCMVSVADTETFCVTALDDFRQNYQKQALSEKEGLMEGISSLVESLMAKQQAVVDEKLRNISERFVQQSRSAAENITHLATRNDAHSQEVKAWLSSYENSTSEWESSVDAKQQEISKTSEDLAQGVTGLTTAISAKLTDAMASEKERCTKFASGLESVGQSVNAESKKVEDDLQANIGTFTDILVNVHSATDSWLAANAGHSESVSKDTETHKATIAQQRTESSGHLQRLSTEVELYVTERLKVDVPTGQTPQKRSFDIPAPGELQDLCAPHNDTLKSQFRAQRAGNHEQGEESLDAVPEEVAEEEEDDAASPEVEGAPVNDENNTAVSGIRPPSARLLRSKSSTSSKSDDSMEVSCLPGVRQLLPVWIVCLQFFSLCACELTHAGNWTERTGGQPSVFRRY